MMSVHLELEYPSEIASEAKLVQRLRELFAANHVSSDEQRAFTLAVSEAFTNALIHGNQFDPDKTIKICLDINESSLRADIIDQGRNGLRDVNQPRQTDPLADGGRGIGLMERYVSEVQFEQTGDGGLKVSITLERKQLTNIE
ncbi:MAG: ATP-binding protein [candidate division Zixibacteria bacterium]|nr:ATP-binding protein [candidate division Zixibacteria bacterium]MDH3938352.1 ATP-binding protein [candidate division Zixibacteria bacterium]MDH4032717.1 ATP-binding protein [candidate division Zixibacteria bacterium]